MTSLRDDIPQLEAALTANPGDVKNVLDDFTRRSTFEADKDFSLAPHVAAIDRIFSRPSVEEIVDLLAADKDNSEFAAKALKALQGCI